MKKNTGSVIIEKFMMELKLICLTLRNNWW